MSITSADLLARELFTYRGAGTLVRQGEDIHIHEAPDADTLAMVADRVQASFGRTLSAGWRSGLAEPVVLLSDSGRAAAVVVKGADGLPYLDKFVVTPDGQGEGLAAALWQVLRARYPQLYWRSRNANPITGWYFQQADAADRQGPWVVFSIGVEDFRQRERLVNDAMARDSGWEDEA